MGEATLSLTNVTRRPSRADNSSQMTAPRAGYSRPLIVSAQETYRVEPGELVLLPFEDGEATLVVYDGPVELGADELAALVAWLEDRGRIEDPLLRLRRDPELGTLRFQGSGQWAWYGLRDGEFRRWRPSRSRW